MLGFHVTPSTLTVLFHSERPKSVSDTHTSRLNCTCIMFRYDLGEVLSLPLLDVGISDRGFSNVVPQFAYSLQSALSSHVDQVNRFS